MVLNATCIDRAASVALRWGKRLHNMLLGRQFFIFFFPFGCRLQLIIHSYRYFDSELTHVILACLCFRNCLCTRISYSIWKSVICIENSFNAFGTVWKVYRCKKISLVQMQTQLSEILLLRTFRHKSNQKKIFHKIHIDIAVWHLEFGIRNLDARWSSHSSSIFRRSVVRVVTSHCFRLCEIFWVVTVTATQLFSWSIYMLISG